MKNNVAVIPTENMRSYLEKDQKLHLESLLFRTSISPTERKLLRCLEFNDDGVKYRRDQVVDLINQCEDLLIKASDLCPEATAEVLLVMARHIAMCAPQAAQVDITEFYDRTPCKPTDEQWVAIRDIALATANPVQEETSAKVIQIADLRAKREEALAKVQAVQASKTASGGNAS